MLLCSSVPWLMLKRQITHGLFCKRASAKPAARVVGIYEQCELRLPLGLCEGSQLNYGHLP